MCKTQRSGDEERNSKKYKTQTNVKKNLAPSENANSKKKETWHTEPSCGSELSTRRRKVKDKYQTSSFKHVQEGNER